MIKTSIWGLLFLAKLRMKERIVIIFIAVTLGLLATTVAFFLYESAKPAKTTNTQEVTPAVKNNLSPADSFLLVVTEPKDESITANRTVQIKGKTNPENTIIVSSNQDDVTLVPTSDGDFTGSIAISAGVNKIITTAINPEGDSKIDTKIVSFSAEEF